MTSLWSELAPVMQDNGNVLIEGQTFTPGQGSIVLSGTTVIMGTDGALYAGNTLLGSFPVPTDAPGDGQAGGFEDDGGDALEGDAQDVQGGSSSGDEAGSASMRIGDYVMSAFDGGGYVETSSVAETGSSDSSVPGGTASPSAGVSDSVKETVSSSQEAVSSSTETTSSDERNPSPTRGDGESIETPATADPNGGVVLVKTTNNWALVCMAAVYAAL